MPYIRKLANGLTVVGETLSHMRSVCLGLWIPVGSLHESPQENGISHLIEHMVFKGTQRRSSRDIADEMDGVGGVLNAFTTKEATCLYARVVDAHLPLAVDILMDMALDAKMDAQELDRERDVVLEEIAMVEDTPEDLVHELLCDAALAGNPLAQPILGVNEGIRSYRRENLARFRATHYRPDNTVLAVAGRYDSAALRELAERYLGSWQPAEAPDMPAWERCFTPGLRRRNKDIEQVHLCVGFPGVALGDADIYPLSVFNNLFGGGMSSRLFQRIREESGMAYTVYSYPTAYPGCGLYTLYAGTSAQHAPRVLEMLREEVERVLRDGVETEEFRKAREQLKGGFILGQESASSHMSSLGRGELLLRRVQDEDEVIERVNATTMEDVMRVARNLLSGPNAASAVGRGAEELPEELLLWRR